MSQYGGKGQLASSDGQRWGVCGRSLLAAFSPRSLGSDDRAVRVAASRKTRIVRANGSARRLASRAASPRWAKALRPLGQLVRTISLLRYLHDPVIRQQVRTQLKRGAARQALAQWLFCAEQGLVRSGDDSQMMNRARCVSGLSNAVWVYNTVRLGRVLEPAKAPGQACTPAAVAHLSPLVRRHVLVNGTYDFAPAQGAVVESGLCGSYVSMQLD